MQGPPTSCWRAGPVRPLKFRIPTRVSWSSREPLADRVNGSHRGAGPVRSNDSNVRSLMAVDLHSAHHALTQRLSLDGTR